MLKDLKEFVLRDRDILEALAGGYVMKPVIYRYGLYEDSEIREIEYESIWDAIQRAVNDYLFYDEDILPKGIYDPNTDKCILNFVTIKSLSNKVRRYIDKNGTN